MSVENKKVFPAESQDLASMMSWVREIFIAAGCEKKFLLRVELALEEALVNVMTHAYGNKAGSIEICLETNSRFVRIHIRDFGPPFNPLAQAIPNDLDATIETRKVGGLGIHLIRQVMDEVTYCRETGSNLLTMVKYYPQKL